jgi:hypothetical protein
MGAADKRKHARELVCDHGLDFIGIKETQLEDFKNIWLDQTGSRQDLFMGICCPHKGDQVGFWFRGGWEGWWW